MIEPTQVLVVALGVFLSLMAGGCWLELRSIRRAVEPRPAYVKPTLPERFPWYDQRGHAGCVHDETVNAMRECLDANIAARAASL